MPKQEGGIQSVAQADQAAVNPSSELEKLREELKLKEQELAERDALLEQSRDKQKELQIALSSSSDSVGGSEGKHLYVDREIRTPTKGTQWPFRVAVLGKTKVEPREIKAVDESEAIRLFALLSKDEDGKPLDTCRVRVQAVCLDPSREKKVRDQYLRSLKEKREYVPALS